MSTLAFAYHIIRKKRCTRVAAWQRPFCKLTMVTFNAAGRGVAACTAHDKMCLRSAKLHHYADVLPFSRYSRSLSSDRYLRRAIKVHIRQCAASCLSMLLSTPKATIQTAHLTHLLAELATRCVPCHFTRLYHTAAAALRTIWLCIACNRLCSQCSATGSAHQYYTDRNYSKHQ